MMQNGRISGLNLRISLYGDDTVIFANPIKEEVDNMLDLLISFGQATGLKLNQEYITLQIKRNGKTKLYKSFL